MKVLERAIMPDGTKIQIEDWRENHPFIKTLSIASYPIMQKLPKRKMLLMEVGKPFRVAIEGWKDDEEVKKAFEDLKNGTKQIKCFENQFRYLWCAECL